MSFCVAGHIQPGRRAVLSGFGIRALWSPGQYAHAKPSGTLLLVLVARLTVAVAIPPSQAFGRIEHLLLPPCIAESVNLGHPGGNYRRRTRQNHFDRFAPCPGIGPARNHTACPDPITQTADHADDDRTPGPARPRATARSLDAVASDPPGSAGHRAGSDTGLAVDGRHAVCALAGHLDWGLGLGKTVKSSVGWAKGWALIPLFILTGTDLPIRREALVRGQCKLGLWTLCLAPPLLAAPYLGQPSQSFTSPLKAVGGPGPEYFSVYLYAIDPAS